MTTKDEALALALEALEKHGTVPLDWACENCRPNSDMLKAGFQCRYHAAITAIKQAQQQEKAIVSRDADADHGVTLNVYGDHIHPNAAGRAVVAKAFELAASKLLQAQQAQEPLYRAAINCPHEIDRDQVVLKFDPKQPGHNALNQLGRRLDAAIAAQNKG